MDQEYSLDNTTKKLVLLFLMEKMEIPLTENSIIDICTNRNNWIPYMDCIEVIYSLIKSHLIYTPEEHVEEPRYTLTYEGRNCLALFFQKVPTSLRDSIVSFAKLNVSHIKRKQEYVSSYQKMADGSYLTTFTIREPHLCQPIFEIKVKMNSRSGATGASKKWIEKAPEVYETIFEMLLSED